jgi:hypothetical protein
MASYAKELAHLRALLNSGATSVLVDGQNVAIDPAGIRKRIRELEALDDTIDVPTRPPFFTADLSGLP